MLSMTTRENTPASADVLPRRTATLTPAEWRVLTAILAGHTTHRSIAAATATEESTTGQHLMHIYQKTGAANMADLVLMAVGRKCGYIDFSEIIWE